MSNINYASGFTPVRYKNGTAMICDYLDISSSNSVIDKNDLLERAADGYIQRATATSRSIVGVAAEHKAANAGGKVAFYPIQGLIMEAQVDNGLDARTDIGNAFDILPGSPASSGISQMQIDGSTKNTTASLPIKVEGLVERVGVTNDFGDYAKVLCVVNESHYGAGSIGL